MSRWLPIDSAPRDGTKVLMVKVGFVPAVAWWDSERQSFDYVEACTFAEYEHWQAYLDMDCRWDPTHWMPLPPPPSDTDDLDAQLSPESLADVQAGRQVCRAIYTGLAEVASLESLKPKE